ncbi:hypothetical protein [Streptococcus pluranimalium]|uniref:Uncharacterized protein n=1 Tax=Streptococcus pluranimalium TaxID=82348 RepID=A0A2L0D5P5_9STRE|nr:hypothetical protein [Streptococcus pluranimalium]AUW97153.1 hypothetical protein C0J00_08580 [Streptococcus pluranimalium]
MQKTYTKLATKEQQTLRKHRIVFTSTKGILKKQKWIILDIDEHGITYRGRPSFRNKMFFCMYQSIDQISIDDQSFILTIKINIPQTHSHIYQIDLKEFDGELWNNFIKIRDVITSFAGNKLEHN